MKKEALIFYILLIILFLGAAVSCRGGFHPQKTEQTLSLEQEAASVAAQAAAAATAAAEVASGTRVPFVPVPDAGPAAAMATVQALDPNQGSGNDPLTEQVGALATQAADLLEQAIDALGQVELPNFSDVLIEKFTAVQITGDNSYTVTLTDVEMTQKMQAAQAANAASGNFGTLQNPTAQFTNGQMIFSGTMTEPNLGAVSVTLRPFVQDGRLQVEVVSATVSDNPVPVFVLQGAEATLNSTLSAAFNNLPAGFVLQSVTITEGIMSVTAIKV
ncbi:MAG: hypothetical protein KC419_26020 [Anaerolineales bacterium]|nr:hypothetical protein [Anaerolineales bacterium]